MTKVHDISGSTSSGGGSTGGGGSTSTASASTASSGGGGSTSGTPQWFARQVLKGLGLPVTTANVNWLTAWESREGGHWENTAQYNPLNTTLAMPGSSTMNGVGVRVYTSWQQGIEATVKTLAESRYSDIRSALHTGSISLDQHFNSLMAWSGNGYDNVSGGTVNYHPTGSGGGGGGGGAGSAGGAGGAHYTAATDASGPSLDLKQLERTYGSIAAVLNDAGLANLVQKAVGQGWDDATFQAKLRESKFYQKHSDAQRNWLLLWNGGDPGEAHHELKQREHDINKTAGQMGVSLNNSEVHDLAWKSLYVGMSDQQWQQSVGHHFEMTKAHAEGQAGSIQDQYAQLADAYGLPVSRDTLQHWIRGSLTGNIDPGTVRAHLIDQAKTMYPGLAKQLDAGQTVGDVASVYRDTMANLLELDPSQLSWRDPEIKHALQFQSDPSQPSTLMPLYQFEHKVRSDPRWLNTNNAKQSFQDVGVQVLKDMGLTA